MRGSSCGPVRVTWPPLQGPEPAPAPAAAWAGGTVERARFPPAPAVVNEVLAPGAAGDAVGGPL
jgi:hypothetical protein